MASVEGVSEQPEEDPRLRLAYEAGQHALAIQRDDLERMRTRATALVSVASLAVGLLGGVIGSHAPHRNGWFFFGLAAFVVLIVCVCLVLAPYVWHWEVDPRKILTDFVDAGHDLNGTLKWLANHDGDNGDHNEKRLDRLATAYLVGVAALGVTVLSLALALLTGR